MRYLMTLIFFLSLPAQAFEPVAAEAELGDILSPAEIAAELLEEEYVDSDYVAPQMQPRMHVVVDKSEQRLWVYEDGHLTGSWLVSTGTEERKCAPSKCYIAHTPVGIFTPQRMYYTYTSKLWNARMDRAIFIVGGIALHATYGENLPYLGRRASGGCVRQHPDNADLLFRKVKFYGPANTRVQIQE